jgi:hypothetical protein
VFDTTTKAYNIDKKIDYFTIRSMVIQSLENIVREELNLHIASINLNKTFLDIQQEDKEGIVIVNSSNNLFDDQDDGIKLSASLLKLKIRNTTAYLNWRIAILKRDNFKCRMCNASIKDKGLRLEVHHAKSFNDICKENNITTIQQALTCKQIWSLDNGISLCYGCHKSLEKKEQK